MLFHIFNYAFLTALAALCILPLIHVLAVSFSSSLPASAGQVTLWPVDFTWASYEYVVQEPAFLRSLGITLLRVALGVSLNMFLTILVAYPLAKEVRQFRYRTAYAWAFVFSMLFSGGLIPMYMLIRSLGMIDTIWALVLPGAIPVFNVVLLLNFYRSLPKELEEAAFMDGAGHWRTLWTLYVPLSLPALATIGLFATVGHWNSWFDGIIYMNSPDNYPLQSYLRTVVVQRDLSSMTYTEALQESRQISDRTLKAAQIFLGALPILLLYPFLQRYFMQGIVLGSVKG